MNISSQSQDIHLESQEKKISGRASQEFAHLNIFPSQERYEIKSRQLQFPGNNLMPDGFTSQLRTMKKYKTLKPINFNSLYSKRQGMKNRMRRKSRNTAAVNITSERSEDANKSLFQENLDGIDMEDSIFNEIENSCEVSDVEMEERFLKLRSDPEISKQINKKWILLPDDTCKGYWEIIMLIMLIYTATVTPFRISFTDEDPLGWTIADFTVDFFFGMDLVLNFFSAYYDSYDNLITSRKEISKNYLKGWFFPDFIAIFPLGQILQSGKNYNSLLRLSKLSKMYRMIKITKLVRIFKKMRQKTFLSYFSEKIKINNGMERLLFIFYFLLILVHIISCFFYLTAKLSDFEPDTWVIKNGYEQYSPFDLYLIGCHWTLQSFVRRASIESVTGLEKGFSLFVTFIGVVGQSLFISSLTSIISSMDKNNAKLNHDLKSLEKFRADFKLRPTSYMKIRNFLKYNIRKAELAEYEFLELLPSRVRASLILLRLKESLSKIDFFRNKKKDFVAFIAQFLKGLNIFKGDEIYKKGEAPDCVYFIVSGKVGYFPPKYPENPYVLINPDGILSLLGEFFGEEDLLQKVNESNARYFSVKALEDCEFLVLKKKVIKELFNPLKDVLKALNEFPKIMSELFSFAQTKKNVFSDLCRTAEAQLKSNEQILIESLRDLKQSGTFNICSSTTSFHPAIQSHFLSSMENNQYRSQEIKEIVITDIVKKLDLILEKLDHNLQQFNKNSSFLSSQSSNSLNTSSQIGDKLNQTYNANYPKEKQSINSLSFNPLSNPALSNVKEESFQSYKIPRHFKSRISHKAKREKIFVKPKLIQNTLFNESNEDLRSKETKDNNNYQTTNAENHFT